MNILLTGVNGFVGRRIREKMPVIAAPSLRSATEDDVRAMIDAASPDVIIHTAAISDIGTCEQNPEASLHANVLVPQWIARAAGSARQIYFSSDQVYSGLPFRGPYVEEAVSPANIYARHKLAMENSVLAAAPHAILLRATWMYDMPVYQAANRGNFLMNLLQAAAAGKELTFSSQQVRAVTYVRDVADKIQEILNGSVPGGVYNFGSENTLDMLETARLCADMLDLHLQITDTAPRHDLNMDCSKLRRCGIAFPDTMEGMRRCKADYGL